jgi:hypothetical protein
MRPDRTETPDIAVLWDHAHIWGLLLHHALDAWGFPHRLLTARQVAGGDLLRKPPAALIVPGGMARKKAAGLGRTGLAAVRDYVSGSGRDNGLVGGSYYGFCGGSGLGLLGGGLDLCPWSRRGFASRLHHFTSGHVRAELVPEAPDAPTGLFPDGLPADPLLPVWWPGRFQQGGGPVRVLAGYQEPGPDFWVADMALATLPDSAIRDWEHLYGVSLWPTDMTGAPLVVHGDFGHGSYLLSYSHLETPDSPQANLWLAHLLARDLGAPLPRCTRVPDWKPGDLPLSWDDPVLSRARRQAWEIIALGREQLLLYERTSWLLGWRRGLPGLSLNSLHALLAEITARDPWPAALAFWQEESRAFAEDMDLFSQGVTGYLLAERLDMTLTHSPGTAGLPGLAEQRAALFGSPPEPGGLHHRLQTVLEELARLQLSPGPA